MCGCGSGAILAALPIPLGSTLILFMPPTLAGPGGMPLIGTFPAPASPAIRANEAAGGAKASSNAIAILAEVLDMAKLHGCLTRTSVDEADVGREFAGTIKMNVRKCFGGAARAWRPAARRERTPADIGEFHPVRLPRGTLARLALWLFAASGFG